MRSIHIILITASLLTFRTACGQLPLPTVPSTLTVPSLRADYIATHFYDGMNWNDTSMTSSNAVMQDWANFLSVLPHCNDSVAKSALYNFLVSVPSQFITTYADMADGYLFATDSELCNEIRYLEAMNALIDNQNIDPNLKSALSVRYDYLSQSAPGKVAPDITVESLDNSNLTQLNSIETTAPYILIVFYDPECEDCHELLDTLSNSPYWIKRRSENAITIVKSQIDDDTDSIYPIFTVPSLYLIDSASRAIVVRNIPIEQITTYIEHND